MAHDRDLGVVHDVADEGIAAARDKQVHAFMATQQLIDLAVRLGLKQAFRGKPRLHCRILDDTEKRPIGRCGFPTALQDGAVAAFQAQGGNLHQGVRARFENDADHADRAAETPQFQALVQLARQLLHAQGIGKGNELLDACDHVRQLNLVELQALHHGSRNARFLGRGHILRIRSENGIGPLAQATGHQLQCSIALLDRACSQNRRGQLHIASVFLDSH